MFDDLNFVHLVVVDLVLMLLQVYLLFVIFSVLAKRLAGKSVSEISYLFSVEWDVKP